jgi:hypothetical protein
VRLRARGADVRGLVPCVGIGAAASHCEMWMRVVGGAVGWWVDVGKDGTAHGGIAKLRKLRLGVARLTIALV